MKFLQNFAAAFLALAVFFGMGFFFFIILIASMDTTEKFTVRDNSILKIELTQPLADRDFRDDFESFDFLSGASMNRIGVVELRKALNHAATDNKIRGVYLYAPVLEGGYVLGQEVREALTEFKKSGKFIWAYGEFLTEGGFYMSSVADRIYITPEGAIEWNGLDAELTFFKNAFDKLDIKPQIFRVGEYKSAIEPFILEKMSDENREQMNSMLNSIYGSLVADMAVDLDLSSDELLLLSKEMTVKNLDDAIEHGLITGKLYRDEFKDLMAKEIGEEDGDNINWVSYRQYNQAITSSGSSKNRIAVVIAEGDIMMANEQKGVITPEQFVDELKRVREDDNIKAVVFRINSPGGDPLASDLIWHEVAKTAEVKPIIASMSNYAASGGYYIAMAADSIVAAPTTLTGSIGIFGMVFNIGDFMANKLGITTDRVTTGDYSNLFTATRALTYAEKEIIQNQVNRGYEAFTTKAAQGRNMSLDQLKAVASGRVWTGTQALDNGLVDALGGLQTAIDMAASAAGVQDDYRVRYYPTQKTSIEELVERFSSNSGTTAMKTKLGEIYPYFTIYKRLENMRGMQARMPFDITIK